MTKKWKYSRKTGLGFFDELCDALGDFEISHPNAYPELYHTDRIVVVSDYSGDAKSAQYEALAFLIMPFDGGKHWKNARREVRHTFLSDGRSMSYKNLGSDRQRGNALPHFLEAADKLHGILAIVLVDKRIDSLFETNGLRINEIPELSLLKHWKGPVLEKAVRVINFVCCILNGLGEPGQTVLWITDQDPTVANEQRQVEFNSLLMNISQSYPRVLLADSGVVTTKMKVADNLFEDLAAIPDLAAGGLVHLLDEWPEYLGALRLGLSIPVPNTLHSKTRAILRWLQDDGQSLRRLMLIIDRDSPSRGFNAMILKFHSLPMD